jgi:hypothetical protein
MPSSPVAAAVAHSATQLNWVRQASEGLYVMNSNQDGTRHAITALLTSVFNELSLTGKLMSFFAIVLLFWSMYSFKPEKVLLALSLLWLTPSGYHWDRRISIDPFPPMFPNDPPRQAEIRWRIIALAVFFLVLAIVFAYIWFKLPSVQKFLSTVLSNVY